MSAKRSTMTVLSTALIVLAMGGCAPLTSMPAKPTAPSGLTTIAGDGLVCYPAPDHAQIMRYIVELERGYGTIQ